MELYELLPDFRMESLEWIESMESSLLLLDDTPGCCVAINNLFREVCKLKASAGLYGLNSLVELACAMEKLLVCARDGDVSSDERLSTLLWSCCVHMRAMIEQTSSTWTGRQFSQRKTTVDDLLSQMEDFGSSYGVLAKAEVSIPNIVHSQGMM